MEMVKYSSDGFWVKKEENLYKVGLTIDDIEDVGEIAFVDLPKKGSIEEGDSFVNVEASKVVSEFTSPLSGSIVGINEALMEAPENLKSDDADKNWIAIFENVPEEVLLKLKSEKPGTTVSHVDLS
jgi:glycine cleavage system H protein